MYVRIHTLSVTEVYLVCVSVELQTSLTAGDFSSHLTGETIFTTSPHTVNLHPILTLPSYPINH